MATCSRLDPQNDNFAARLKRVRTRLHAKQFWLAREVGCSEAAISHWENGSRLPRQNTMRRVFQALERGGALPDELMSLLVAWRDDLGKRIAASAARDLPRP
jgi:transcriptional regulator with XRE-family HTH domain